MRLFYRCLYCSIITCLVLFASAQEQKEMYPQDYFRDPLNIAIQLAANFGEVRPNHFHMGLDIRTQGRENLPVYAAGEGYVSRVKIDKWGYGRAIYISHPNGFTTVYGHLNDFYKELDDKVKALQYASESWEQDLEFKPGELPLAKGQFIAFSGNTGGSAGPHLHFEIRDTETGNCLNPQLFGLAIPDRIAPVIHHLYWYDRRYSTYQLGPQNIAVIKKGSGYTSLAKTVKLGSPLLSFAVSAEDKSSNSPFQFGIYGAETWLDDKLINAFEMDDFSYEDSRYVNACIDYSTYLKSKTAIQHLSVLPGNTLPIFEKVESNGTVMLTDSLPHQVKIIIKDANGNTTTFAAAIQFDASLQKDYQFTMNSIPFSPGEENTAAGEDIKAVFTPADFYDVVPFILSEQPAEGRAKASVLVGLHNQFVPVNDSFAIRIKTTLPVGSALRKKVVMFKTTGSHKEATRGDWDGDWMQTKFNRLGNFQLLIDTLPPVVRQNGWKNGTIFSTQRTLALYAKDELDEINDFRAELDGKWLLFAKKNDYFIYSFDEHCPPGTHELKITVKDHAGNSTEEKFRFIKK